jgi:hypothetical protein
MGSPIRGGLHLKLFNDKLHISNFVRNIRFIFSIFAVVVVGAAAPAAAATAATAATVTVVVVVGVSAGVCYTEISSGDQDQVRPEIKQIPSKLEREGAQWSHSNQQALL